MIIFRRKNVIFLIFAPNIDCEYTLEPPHRAHCGGSNEYSQSMFWSKNMKNCIPLLTPILLNKREV